MDCGKARCCCVQSWLLVLSCPVVPVFACFVCYTLPKQLRETQGTELCSISLPRNLLSATRLQRHCLLYRTIWLAVASPDLKGTDD